MRPYNDHDKIVLHTLEHGGGTFLLPNMYPIHPHAKVWCLSLDDNRGIVVPIDDFHVTAVAVWLLNGNQDYINQWNSRHTNYGSIKCVGTWVDEGNVYIDVTTVIAKDDMSLDAALELGRANNQRAIWDN